MTSCPSSTTNVGSVCQTCAGCKTCSGSASTCTSCNGADMLYNSECFSTCPNGTLAGSGTCTECDSKCATCVNSVDECSSCSDGLFLQEVDGKNDCIVCPSGYKGDSDSGRCVTDSSVTRGPIIPFPFLIIMFIFFLIALGGRLKNSSSQVLGNMIALWSFVETFAFFFLAITAWATAGSLILMMVILVIWIIMLVTNLTWAIYFRKVISKDPAFQEYKKRHKKTALVILILSTLFSFKISRFYYTRFFGLDYFSASFESKDGYMLPLTIFSVVNFGVTYLPILIIDFVSIFYFSWGSQYYITCIETIFMILLILLFTLIEFRTGKILDYEPLD